MENSKIIALPVLLSLIAVFASAQEISIRPNWKKGDERRVTASSETICLIEGDTLINSSASATSRIKVENITKEGYIVSYTHESMETPEFNMPMLDTIDKAQAIFAVIGGLMKAAEKVAQDLKVSYVIDPAGEAVSVANFNETFNDYRKGTITVMNDFAATLKKTFGDSIDFPLNDSTKINSVMDSMKDKLHQQLLNSVNYFNQAYYGVTYDKTKSKTTKAVISEFNVIKYGDVEIDGQLITEVLNNSGNSFKVKITTEYDHASLKKAFKEQLKKEVGELSYIEDRMILEYEPSSFWIRKIEDFQHIKINEIEVKTLSTTVFQK